MKNISCNGSIWFCFVLWHINSMFFRKLLMSYTVCVGLQNILSVVNMTCYAFYVMCWPIRHIFFNYKFVLCKLLILFKLPRQFMLPEALLTVKKIIEIFKFSRLFDGNNVPLINSFCITLDKGILTWSSADNICHCLPPDRSWRKVKIPKAD